ncbi:hypothetical protein HQ529_00035 [Candidatus Woesearchaeota archaeon]|nr:hypothetical protein [Candidatus Woesearchaeota archaeon]
MAPYNLVDFVEWLESWGLTDVMLPFLLIFTILFAILQKTRVMGDEKKNLNVIISMIISLMVVIPHVLGSYPSEAWDPVVIMNNALPTVSLLVVAIIMMLILIGIFGGEARFLGATLPGFISFASVVLIILIFGGSAGWWPGFWDWLMNLVGADAVALIIIILVFGIIIAFITSEPKDREERSTFGRVSSDLKRLFGGEK